MTILDNSNLFEVGCGKLIDTDFFYFLVFKGQKMGNGNFLLINGKFLMVHVDS